MEVQMTEEHIDRNAKVSPKEAIKELIWNACDADATNIDISFVMNYFGQEGGKIEQITITDNGHGIAHDEMRDLFGLFGRSCKTYKGKSPKGRLFHGKQGQGRYKSFSLGSRIEWISIYRAVDGLVYKFSASFDGTNKMKVSYSQKERVPESTETGVTVVIDGLADNIDILLDKDKMEDDIVSTFAPYLLSYGDIQIIYNDRKIDPLVHILSTTETPIDYEHEEEKRSANVRIILWKTDTGKGLYICGENGVAYETRPVSTKGHPLSVYILSSVFDEMSKDNIFACGIANPFYDAFIALSKRLLGEYINKLFYSDSVEEVRKLKETDAYPYKGDVKSKIDDTERQYFDLVAVELNNVLPSLRSSSNETKKLTYRLIKEAVKTNPDNLTTILTEVFNLSKEQQNEFARLLDNTTLPSIISMTRTVSERLLFVQALEQMVYDKATGTSIRERTQFHRILLEELWVFGEEYKLGASDVSLKTVLKKHQELLGRTELTPEIPQEAAANLDLIPDLCLYKQYILQNEKYENLVIELKRPTKILTKKELDQIEGYAFAVSQDARFPKESTKWNFILLGCDFDAYVQMKLQDQKSGKGNFYNSGNVSISVQRWNTIIQQNKIKFSWLNDRLKYTMEDNEQALDYLHKKYTSLFSQKEN